MSSQARTARAALEPPTRAQVSQAMRSPLSRTPAYLRVPLGALAAIALLGLAQGARAQSSTWAGQFTSVSQGKTLTVQLMLPGDGKPGNLRFEPVACSVDLVAKDKSSKSIEGDYTVVSTALRDPGAVSGPYCSVWLDGTLQLSKDESSARMRMVLQNGESVIRVGLTQK